MKVREPAVAGSFYPATPSRLRREVEELLGKATSKELSGRILGVVSPHAGYVYSGGIAAASYRLLKGRKIGTVIIVGPSHFVGFNGISVYPDGSWFTPLGEVKIDEEIARELLGYESLFIDSPDFQSSEHSIEVQLPFLQVVLENFKFVPLMVGEINESMLSEAGKVLESILERRDDVVIVASTDLYHGYSYEECVDTDRRTIELVKKGDAKQFYRSLRSGEVQACGGYGVALLLEATKGFDRKIELVSYTNSHDVTGSKVGYVVGYASLAIWMEKDDDPVELTEKEKEELLRIAKESVKYALQDKEYEPKEPVSELLKMKTGVFVTLRKGEELRGCVGYVFGVKPLYQLVKDAALQAAFNDPRFNPLSPEEFNDVSFEISILTPPTPIKSPKEIEIGRDGLIVKKGPFQGLLLPQVATENNWDVITFLDHTCLKAGLSPGCWKDPDTEVYKFSALVFEEE